MALATCTGITGRPTLKAKKINLYLFGLRFGFKVEKEVD